MPDTAGMYEIRGLDIDKLAKGFADEEFVFKSFCQVSTTSAREIRWYQKTSGTLTATSPSRIANVSELSMPSVLETSWTRQTSYIKKYIVDSPMISAEDIRDSDVDILARNVRDLTRAIAYQVDTRIWNVATENQSASLINSVTSTAAWDAASGQDPIEDILEAKQKIRSAGYNPEGAVLLLNSYDHKSLLTWLISSKGASIPTWASGQMTEGKIMNILGLDVLVSENVTTDYAAVIVKQRAVSWKSFMPITATTIEDKGIGIKIRVWEEGEAILTDPKAVSLISNTKL
jgi:hypothetical protein